MAGYKKSTIKNDGSQKIVCQNKKCAKMGRFQSVNNFYKSRNPEFPHHPYCKECVNESIDIYNLQTIYDVLRGLDTPFIMNIWNEVVTNNETDYFGNYMKEINNKKNSRYSIYRWADSIFELTEEENGDKHIEVSNEVKKQLEDIPVWSDEWYGEYTKADLKYLDDYYNSLKKDFKIVTRNHQDYARKIAQASLDANKAYDIMKKNPGDKDSANAYKMALSSFDMLSKSAQFSESTRSANDISLGSFGVLFDKVEKHEWIPEYVPGKDEEDIYDKMIKQFANIEKSL